MAFKTGIPPDEYVQDWTMPTGYDIVDLPNGEKEFRLEQPVLNWIRIDYQARLQFGPVEIVIESPFSVVIAGGTTHNLDPEQRSGLGPFVALYPNTLIKATMTRHGELRLDFLDGRHLTVPPDDQYEAWSVGGFWCLPGGFP